jgi:hypothetical protein
VPGLRSAFVAIRESVVLFGLSDAIYYAAPDGERAVRDTVFRQVFEQLQESADEQISLHIVAHSLGVTVAHDFLYALFGRKYDPEGYPKDAPTAEQAGQAADLDDRNRRLQDKWRDRAEAGSLVLGTFISFASQLPLFVMRKQALVERLASRRKLDPRVIGIDSERATVQWANFYDSDELLGFAHTALYEQTGALCDLNVNSGLDPLHAHLGYWHKPAILARCVEILKANTR